MSVSYIGEKEASRLSIDEIRKRIEQIKSENAERDMTPYVDSRYICETCFSPDHLNDPENGFCWHCRTDDWKGLFTPFDDLTPKELKRQKKIWGDLEEQTEKES